MGLDINGINNYELYGKNQKVGANPFAAQRKPEQKVEAPAFQGNQKLDPAMLSEKRENFLNGLGGTNNSDDHKIFYAA